MIVWESLESRTPVSTSKWYSVRSLEVYRAKVPSGWLISVCQGDNPMAPRAYNCTFYPDPTHVWYGSSIAD